MAIVAGNFDVGTFQQKIGLCVVVEQPEVPGDRIVAPVAGVFEPAIMVVVFQVATDAVFFCVDKYLGLVTIDAFDVRMFSEQRKPRQVMIKERCIFPHGFVVAIGTLFALRAIVRVVLEMAGDTGCTRGCREYWLDVTIDAGIIGMRSVQLELSVPVVIEQRLGPCHAVVAVTAFRSVVPFMLVVFKVTTDAGHIHFVAKRIVAVTVITSELCMMAFKRKVGISRVVEAGVGPRCRVVAILALVPAAPIMMIIFRMAVVARIWCACEFFNAVAVFARRFGMTTDQFVIR